MIVSDKKIRLYIRNILESIVYGDNHGWSVSDDSDWPAPTGSPFNKKLRSRYAIFIGMPEEYNGVDPNQKSHGGYSHAIKHMYEFNQDIVIGVLKKVLRYVINLSKIGKTIYKVSKRTGESQLVGNTSTIKLGDVLNTLDWINDAMYYNIPIPRHYQRMFEMSKPIYDAYWNELRSVYEKAVDVSDVVFPEVDKLIEFLRSEPAVKFYASFKGKEPSVRILDTSNSVLYGETPDGRIATYFMQEKRPQHHRLDKSLSFISPIKKDGSPSATIITDEYSNLRKVAAMATRGEL